LFLKRRKMISLLLFLLVGTFVGILGAHIPGYLFAINVFVISFLLVIFLIQTRANPDHKKFLITIFTTGFLLRVILSIVLYLVSLGFRYSDLKVGFQGFFVGDGWGYYHNGLMLKYLWDKGAFFSMNDFRVFFSLSKTVSAYDYFNGGVIWLMGESPFVFFFLNSLLGAVSVLLVYLIALQLTGEKFARYSAILYCFWPSLVLWSTQNLKEPVCDFAIYLGLLSLLVLLQRFSLWYILCSIISCYALMHIRPTMGVVMVLLFFIFYLILFIREKYKLLLACMAILIFMIAFPTIKEYFLNYTKYMFSSSDTNFNMEFLLERLNLYRYWRTERGSAILPGLQFTNLAGVLLFIPYGFVIVFLMPFPWQIGSALQVMAIPEMFVWYVMLPAAIRGIITCYKKNWDKVVLVLSYMFLMGIILGLVESNLGTLFRHRSSIFGLCLVFAGIGIHLRKKHAHSLS